MGYTFLFIFLLAHMTGDFVLQTDSIARGKASGMKGLLIHVSIITFAQVIFLSAFGMAGILAGAAAGVIHFAVDYTKSSVNKYFLKKQFLLFLLDQAAHTAVICVLSYLAAPAGTEAGVITEVIEMLVVIVFLTFVCTIAVQLLLLDVLSGSHGTIKLEKYERFADAVLVVLLWAGWAAELWIGIVVSLCLVYPYIVIQKRKFELNFKPAIIKYIFYVFVSQAAVYFSVMK